MYAPCAPGAFAPPALVWTLAILKINGLDKLDYDSDNGDHSDSDDSDHGERERYGNPLYDEDVRVSLE